MVGAWVVLGTVVVGAVVVVVGAVVVGTWVVVGAWVVVGDPVDVVVDRVDTARGRVDLSPAGAYS